MHLLPTVKSRVRILVVQLIYHKALQLIQRPNSFKQFLEIVLIRLVIRLRQERQNFVPRLVTGQKLN